MEFIIGSREEFLGFFDSIGKKNIAILSHSDLDGISSAIFLEEILKAKGLEENLKLKKFLDYKIGVFERIYDELKGRQISVVFILDLNPENIDAEGFEKLRREFSVFSIDHHPVGELNDKKWIIKTFSSYCSAHICYDLGEGVIDSEKYKWLVYAAIVSDMGYKNPEVLGFIQKDYPEVTKENIYESESGKISSIITSALVYFDDDVEKIYDLIKNKKINGLKKYDAEIQKEISKWMKKYEKEAEFYPERNLYFYYFNPKFRVRSIVTTLVSNKKPDKTFISVGESSEDKNILGISARNQNGKEDMNKLMKKGIFGLENATAGGHVPAAGGRFMRKDLEKFKENILN